MLRMRSFQEGTVGLFALFGLILFGGLVIWLRGGLIGQNTYQIRAEFEAVEGLQIGASVRFRGVAVGKIIALAPSSNGVNAILELSSTNLRIPRDSKIQINRSGLIGEASVDITPSRTLNEQALSINPTSKECPDKNEIICHDDEVVGKVGPQLFDALNRLSDTYTDPEFVGNLNNAAKNVSKAGDRIAKLSDEVTLFSRSARGQIKGVSRTINSIDGAARNASQLMGNVNTVVTENRADINKTISSAANLINNIDSLVSENRGNITNTLNSLERTSDEARQVAIEIGKTVNRVNIGLDKLNIEKVAKDLESLMNDASQTAANLRNFSQSINDPQVILSLQKTLDSARVTFENAQKITSDVEILTGDPVFRDNIRKLVNGLGNLVSYTDRLEQQVYTSQLLESVTDHLEYQIQTQQQLATRQSSNPTPVSPASIPPISPIQPPTLKTFSNKN
ncbi:MlaD family protein [Aphanothece sacrum]|uniref:ABC-type transporter, periplasmic component n=1 Tax=Aphanothece sacrum FPU1 TaxID=1920663 RepID=A0A401IHT9_APHSA|nr:MlaD family protein [Aphanothece sacrum]GBF80701.1 ABC-type transporter, periplasmic component [Aphanothece sacrum FPU1]GBF83195.1 ABC tarnsporter periplasmic protein [Aphanothece sacrum FPU3]